MDDETEAAVAGISGVPRPMPTPTHKAKTPKMPRGLKGQSKGAESKYPSIPTNPTAVFTYKLKDTQKVHLPIDHPQMPNIKRKERVEVVYNEAASTLANPQVSR